MALLDVADFKDIEAAIAHAEQSSAGELVVAVVKQADQYAGFRAATAMAWSVGLALLAHVLCPAWPCWALLIGQLPCAALVYWGLQKSGLLRYLVPHAYMHERVQARAWQLFAERGVYQTREHSGLLIMLAELEHQVTILGDSGIHARLGDTGWQTHINTLVAGIKAGDTKAALLQVIDSLAATLAIHFAARDDDTNELPNQVVVGS